MNPYVDWWGSRNSSKRIKSYFKDEICAQRVEFKVRSGFLKNNQINDPFDFDQFAEILPRQHVLFAQLDDRKLIERIRRVGFSGRKTLEILRRVAALDLSAALDYLRRDLGLKNVRRLLIELPENRLVVDALEALAARWPKTPSKLKVLGN